MAIEIVTESEVTWDKETLENNAREFLIRLLEDSDVQEFIEPWDEDLAENIITTLKKQV